MKKIIIMTLLTLTGAVTAETSEQGFDYFAQQNKNVASSIILLNNNASTQGSFCTQQCRNEFNQCLAQPDPYNVNLDVCRVYLNMCLRRCGGGGISL